MNLESDIYSFYESIVYKNLSLNTFYKNILERVVKTKPKKACFLKTHGGKGGREGSNLSFYGVSVIESDKLFYYHNAYQVIRSKLFITF
jgi:hypothetical protein